MITKRKSEAARRNGAQSRGPISPEGKARSALNAMKHGLTSRRACLAIENRDAYDRNREMYFNYYAPAGDFEVHLVDKLAALDWRLQRGEAVETSLLDMEIDILGPEIDKAFHMIDNEGLAAIGFKSLSDHSRALPVLDRYQSRTFSQYHRLRAQIAEVQSARFDAAEPGPNEPTVVEMPSDQRPADDAPQEAA